MNDRKVKVAMIELVGGHGGMDYYDFGLCSGLADAGVDVVLYTCDKTEIPNGVGYRVKHSYKGIFGDAPAWKKGLRFVWGSIKAIVSAAVEGRKVVHFHFFNVGVLEAFNVALAKLFFRKVVITSHDVECFVESLAVPKFARWVYAVADSIIAHNQISKHELIHKLGVESDKITIIPHGNYLHMLGRMPEKTQARDELEINPKAKVLLFFGQIKDVKGLDLLLEAMPAVLEQHPDAVLLIAGKPWKSDFLKYQKTIDHLNINHACLKHIRFIQDEEVPTFYAACDMVVLPYRRIYQSGVLLMSMSYGRVTCSSDLPGMKEVVADGETGILFQTESVKSLSGKLIQALQGMEDLKKIESNALELMRNQFDWQVIGDKTKSFYLEVGAVPDN